MLALGKRLGQIFFRLQNSKFRDKAIFSIPRATPGNSASSENVRAISEMKL